MAGSWNHMTAKSGRLLDNERFTGMIENLGDAYEAAEQCYGMIWWLANEVATLIYYDEQPGPPTREQVLQCIGQAQANYQDGLRAGGVQRPR